MPTRKKGKKRGKKRGEKIKLQEETTKLTKPEKVIYNKGDKSLVKYYKALKEYYILKKKYETSLGKLKKKICKKDTSWVEKREEFQRRRKCIVCGQRGGTEFNCLKGIYTANCGHISSPCDLMIQLKRPNIVLIPDEIQEMNDILDDIKLNIIQTKLSLLFGLENEETASAEFSQFRKIYKEGNAYIKELSSVFNDINKLEEKETIIKEAEKTYYAAIETMKRLIQQYKDDNNIANIKELIQTYINEIIKIQTLIRQNQFSIVEVFYNHPSYPNTYRLNKKKRKLEEQEYTKEMGEIIQFNKVKKKGD